MTLPFGTSFNKFSLSDVHGMHGRYFEPKGDAPGRPFSTEPDRGMGDGNKVGGGGWEVMWGGKEGDGMLAGSVCISLLGEYNLVLGV